jgi:hypothetical protein
MEANELIEVVSKELDRFKGGGNATVSVDGMQKYIESLRSEVSASSEYRRQAHEGSLAHYATVSEYNLEMFRSVMEAGRHAIQALLLINGGAVVAMLGMLTNLSGKPTGDVLGRLLALPLLQFGIGVLLAAVCFALRYFSQDAYSASEDQKDKFQTAGHVLKFAAIAAGIGGYFAFGLGIANSYIAVRMAFGS